jgi:hypothetical protein
MTAPTSPLPVPDPGTDPAAFVDAAAILAGLPVDPAFRPGVVANMALATKMAALVMGRPLPVALEPAPVYLPPGGRT